MIKTDTFRATVKS